MQHKFEELNGMKREFDFSFEVSTVVTRETMVFWAVTPCSFVGGYRFRH
jgi:hypothetical protein